MATGTISALKKKKGFGYIDYDGQEKIQFNFSGLDNQNTNLQEGSIVKFSIEEMEPYGKVATNIQVVGNSAIDYLRVKYEAKQELKGLLTKTGTKYRVKDSETRLNIPLVVSKFEEDIEENYEAHANKEVKYKIVSIRSGGLIKAVLINRKFQEGYFEMIGRTFQNAKIIERVTGGMSVATENGMVGFLPNSLAERTNQQFKANDSVNLVCTGYSDNHDTLIYDTLENVTSDKAVGKNNLASDKEL